MDAVEGRRIRTVVITDPGTVRRAKEIGMRGGGIENALISSAFF